METNPPESTESPESVTLLHNAVIITMDPQRRVFRNGAIAIQRDRIIAIGQSLDVVGDFSGRADQIIDLHGQFILPGFINTHVHSSQQLARGIADNVDLMTWLHELILIHSGVTCFAEAGGQHVSAMARAVELLGLRACLAQSTMDSGEGLPASWSIRTTKDCIESSKELFRKHHNTADGRIRVWLGIRQIMNSTDRLLLETKETAKELKTGIHMHVAKIPYENQFVMETRKVNHGTVTYLDRIGLLQSNLLAAHTVWVNEMEISFLSKAGVNVSHCPAAAM